MFRNNLSKLFHFSCSLHNLRCFSSVSPDLKVDIYHILNPFIDFDERIQSDKLKTSIAERNLNINLDNVTRLWKEYKKIEEDKIKLEKSRIEIQGRIKLISSENEKSNKEIESLKLKGKYLRQDLKNISSTLSGMEQMLFKEIFSLPNDIDNNVFPHETKSFLEPITNQSDHIEVGKHLGLVEFPSPMTYFLSEKAAVFELDASSYFSNFFCKNEYIPFSNPDFSRDLIIEGLLSNTDSLFKLEKAKQNYDLYLNGSASYFPFYSFHTKQISSRIPVKYVCQGRRYDFKKSFTDGLYSVWQSNAVQIFVASSGNEILKELKEALKLITQIYTNIGLHFRLVRVPPSELELHEAFRLSVQVHSSFRDKYFEVGNLSFHSDYVSKRLRAYYGDSQDKSFLHVFTGTVMKVPPLLASFIEYTGGCELPKECRMTDFEV